MKQKLLIVLSILTMSIPSKVQAYHFSALCSTGQTLYYNIKTSNTVEVTYQLASYPYYNTNPIGALIIPDSVTYNGFSYSITSIGDYAFYQSAALTSVTIPNQVTSIGKNAFDACSSLASVIVPNTVTSIGNYAFWNCSLLTSITIPNALISIGIYAFYNCKGITSLEIPNTVTYIGESAFNECTGLTSITIPTSIISIMKGTFFKCSSLPSVIIPNSVTSIGESAFAQCRGLSSVTIPNSVSSIEKNAFDACDSLTFISIPNSVTYIGTRAFYYCNKLTYINVDSNNIKYSSIDGVLLNKNKDTLLMCPNGKTANYIIPNSVVSIGNNAFEACRSLTSISIPNTVNSIGISAFNYSGIISLTIPNSVTSIGNSAFYDCHSLTSIIIPNTLKSIGSFAFGACTSLSNITIPDSLSSISDGLFHNCTSLQSIIIPNSIASIGCSAFYNCTNLKSISIPESVTSINIRTFGGCKLLDSIFLPKNITSIGYEAFTECVFLKAIKCKAIIPPVIGGFAFSDINKSIRVYIPCSSKSLYQSKYGWNSFTNYIGEKTLQIVDDTICQGSAFTNYGQNITTSGVYDFVNNCDSIRLNLAVKPNYQTSFFDTVCKGTLYNNYGFNFIADTMGIYTQNLQKTNSCDSIIILNITFFNTINDTITAKICLGQIYNQNGFNADSTGIYTQNLHTINGCDSIITLNLTVNPSPITPNGLLIKKKPTYLEISWDGNGDRYEVYRNDSLIASTSQSIYQDSNLISDSSYCYKVKGFLEACESDISKSVCMRIAGLKDININNQDISLYPNPTSSDIYLKIDQSIIGSGYTITNTIGKILLQGKLLDVSMNINLNDFPQGIYFLNIEKTKQTLKVIKQ